MGVKLMECTLHDGRNIVGDGFDAVVDDMILDGLTACGVPYIEFGNSKGIGAYDLGYTNCLSDDEYLDIASKYMDRGSCLSMFLNSKLFSDEKVAKGKASGL